jgi:hypothetical protein
MIRLIEEFRFGVVTRVYLIDHGQRSSILGSTRPAHAENALLHAAQTCGEG